MNEYFSRAHVCNVSQQEAVHPGVLHAAGDLRCGNWELAPVYRHALTSPVLTQSFGLGA